MGGGNTSSPARSQSSAGLSPRGRGKLAAPALAPPLAGSIPAWAGETGKTIFSPYPIGVYPRVGGGNCAACYKGLAIKGLSPRGRGKLRLRRVAADGARSIPAWAGETASVRSAKRLPRVYPRVGGGNHSRNLALSAGWGLSPRGRGKRRGRGASRPYGRSIPAWAGETKIIEYRTTLAAVYPRVGGGNVSAPRNGNGGNGLSPRGRGKRRLYRAAHGGARSIPAWAGETRGQSTPIYTRRVYPRVGGGNG